MVKKQWRTRTSGSRRQVGKKFMLPTASQQSLKANLPRISGQRVPRPMSIPTVDLSPKESREYASQMMKGIHKDVQVDVPEHKVNLSLTTVKLSDLPPTDKRRSDFEESVADVIDRHKRGMTIAPILVHKLPNGKYEILDGNARIEAYRRLGVTHIPAVENGIGDVLSHVGHFAGKAIGTVGTGARKLVSYTAKHAVPLAKRTAKFGVKATKYGLRSAGEIASSYQAGKEATLLRGRGKRKAKRVIEYEPEEE